MLYWRPGLIWLTRVAVSAHGRCLYRSRFQACVLKANHWVSTTNKVDKSTTIEMFGGTFGNSVLCVCNNLIASAVWFCAELDPVKISPHSGCQYKGSHSKKKEKQNISFLLLLLLNQLSRCWSLCVRASVWLIWVSALQRSSKERGGGGGTREEDGAAGSAMSRLIALLVPLSPGLSCGDGEHYWTTALRTNMRITEPGTLRGTAQTALLTTR